MNRLTHRRWLLALWLTLLLACEPAGQGRYFVISVADGDTITLLDEQRNKVKVRLYGVDAPEKKQAYGQQAKQFTADLCFNKYVDIVERNRDRYGRVVAEVILPDKRILNRELVAAGYAWHYKQYSNSVDLAMLEQEARKARRGLWKDRRPVPPWEYRANERDRKSSKSNPDEPL